MSKRRRKAATHHASELLAQERIAEIEQVTGKTLVLADPQQVINEAIALAHSDITDVLGCVSVDELKKLPPAVRKAIAQVTVHRDYGPANEAGERPVIAERVTFKMHQKIEPLKLLALMTKLIEIAREQSDQPNAQPFTGFQLVLPNNTKKG
jgi:hypothetical protein